MREKLENAARLLGMHHPVLGQLESDMYTRDLEERAELGVLLRPLPRIRLAHRRRVRSSSRKSAARQSVRRSASPRAQMRRRRPFGRARVPILRAHRISHGPGLSADTQPRTCLRVRT